MVGSSNNIIIYNENCCHARFNHIQIVIPNQNIHIDFKLFKL